MPRGQFTETNFYICVVVADKTPVGLEMDIGSLALDCQVTTHPMQCCGVYCTLGACLKEKAVGSVVRSMHVGN